MAARASRTRLASRPDKGDIQPWPEYQAITVVLGHRASKPVGLTSVRSSTRAHSKVLFSTGRVTSHSRSQSGFDSSPMPSGSRTLTSHSSANCRVSPPISAALKGVAINCAMTGSSRWLPVYRLPRAWQAATWSSRQCMFSTLWRAMLPKENSMGTSSNAPSSQRPPRLPGVAGRLLLFFLKEKPLPLTLSRRCRRKRVSSQTARQVVGGSGVTQRPLRRSVAGRALPGCHRWTAAGGYRRGYPWRPGHLCE
ncbi:hypothetical protein D3C81_1429640 [compost metagenome]